MIVTATKVPATDFSILDFARIESGNVILLALCSGSARFSAYSEVLPRTYTAF